MPEINARHDTRADTPGKRNMGLVFKKVDGSAWTDDDSNHVTRFLESPPDNPAKLPKNIRVEPAEPLLGFPGTPWLPGSPKTVGLRAIPEDTFRLWRKLSDRRIKTRLLWGPRKESR